MKTSSSDDSPGGFSQLIDFKINYIDLNNDVVITLLKNKVHLFFDKHYICQEGDIEKIMDLELLKIHKLISIFPNNDRLVVVDIIDDLELFLKNHKGE